MTSSIPDTTPWRAPDWLASVVRLIGFGLVLSAEGFVIGAVGDLFNPANHFSYFTVLSNLAGAAVFGIGLIRPVPDAVRGAVTTYLLTTMVVYAVLLRDADVQTPSFANAVLHGVVPVLMVLDWILVPPTKPIRLRTAALWLIIPALYLVYSLIRGPIAGWYPYPFLDPAVAGGYGMVAIVCVAVAVGIGVIGAVVWFIGTRRAPRPAAT